MFKLHPPILPSSHPPMLPLARVFWLVAQAGITIGRTTTSGALTRASALKYGNSGVYGPRWNVGPLGYVFNPARRGNLRASGFCNATGVILVCLKKSEGCHLLLSWSKLLYSELLGWSSIYHPKTLDPDASHTPRRRKNRRFRHRFCEARRVLRAHRRLESAGAAARGRSLPEAQRRHSQRLRAS